MSRIVAEEQTLDERLNSYPVLKKRFESLLEVVENTNGDLVKAAEAEQRVIEELRSMGNEVLSDWAKGQANKAPVPEAQEGEAKFVSSGKKSSVGTRPLEKSL